MENEDSFQFILRSQHYPDTKTRQRHYKKTTDQHPLRIHRQKSLLRRLAIQASNIQQIIYHDQV